MKRGGRAFAIVLAAATTLSVVKAAPVIPESAGLASRLMIVDLHFHPLPNLSPAAARNRMVRNGVRWAGAGAARDSSGSSVWKSYAEELEDRFIPFAGQSELVRVFRRGGVSAAEDANHPIIGALAKAAERQLRSGTIKGIGEIFVNNVRSNRNPALRRKLRSDSPSMFLLYRLLARHDAFLTVHMHADDDSVAGIERLLRSDRRGRILWNHCGSDTTAARVRPLLRRHPNLSCELSFRYPPVNPPHRADRNIFDDSGPKPDWLALIEEFPDRFLIGTDAHNDREYDGAIAMVRVGLLPYLRAGTAHSVAYRNAYRMFGLR